jgi:hypothetical protein
MSDALEAYNQIKEDGGEAIIIFNGIDMIDPVEEDIIDGTDITVNTYGVRTNFKEELVDGTMIKKDDCKIIVPAYGLDSIDIKNNYTRCSVTFSSTQWNIIDVKPISPSGTDIIYYLHARK